MGDGRDVVPNLGGEYRREDEMGDGRDVVPKFWEHAAVQK